MNCREKKDRNKRTSVKAEGPQSCVIIIVGLGRAVENRTRRGENPLVKELGMALSSRSADSKEDKPKEGYKY